MAVPNILLQGPAASPLFLREAEIRRGVELLYFGYSHLTRAIDEELATQGLGRAHHRALYFIARQPDNQATRLPIFNQLGNVREACVSFFCINGSERLGVAQ